MHKYIYLYIFIPIYSLFAVIMLAKGLAKSNIFVKTVFLIITNISITNSKANYTNTFSEKILGPII